MYALLIFRVVPVVSLLDSSLLQEEGGASGIKSMSCMCAA